MPSYGFPVVVSVFSAIVIAYCARHIPDPTKPWNTPEVERVVAQVRDRNEKPLKANVMPIVVPEALPSPAEVKLDTRLEKLFDYQLKQYAVFLGALETNLFMQVAFILFGLLVLFGRDESFEIPLIKIKLLRSWLHFIVPLALLFLWLRFGFLLDGLVKTRVYGWDLFLQQAGESPTKEYIRTGASLFEDSGFMDGWFALFRPGEHLIDPKLVNCVVIIFPCVFGVLIGANHACLLTIAHVGNARLPAVEHRSVLRRVLLALPWFMFGLLVLSHILFYRGGPNPNWFQVVMPAIAIFLMFLLVFLCRRQPEEFNIIRGAESKDAHGQNEVE
jgi:hypothetical protein